MRKKVGLLGGTFDPIHLGHLRLALELKQALKLDEMRLLPCHKPPHRESPKATSQTRVEMIQLALKDCSDLQLDARELARDKPSYTYDTLCELRAELGAEVSLVLCMGEDAFAGLSQWYHWQELIQLAHIVVMARPGWPLPDSSPKSGAVAELLKKYQQDMSYLELMPQGAVVLQTLRLLPIASSEIRQQIRQGKSAQFLVTDSVWNYIKQHRLYVD